MAEIDNPVGGRAEKDQPAEWPRKQWLALIVLVIVPMGSIAAVAAARKPVGERAGTIVFYAVLAVFGFVCVRFKSFRDAYGRLVVWYCRLVAALVVTMCPIVGASYLSRTLTRFPVAIQIVCFVFWGGVLGTALFAIATKANRDRFLGSLRRIHFVMPTAYPFLVLSIALLFFSSLSFVMFQQGLLRLEHQGDVKITSGALNDFFLWHFLDAIPLFKVNETLKWSTPLTYSTPLMGWMLLIFKAVVIVPALAAFSWQWKVGKMPTLESTLPSREADGSHDIAPVDYVR